MKYNIIIIDDSADYRVLLEKYILRGCPECKITSYDPIAEGKPSAEFPWSRYDVALLDYDLGGENGLDWLAEFNALPGFPPVIFMTGEGSERIAARAIKFGAEDYLPKRDINRESLTQAIDEAARAWDAKPAAVDAKKRFLEILEGARERVGQIQSALFFMEIDQSAAMLESEGPRFLARVVRDATEIIMLTANKMDIECPIFNYSDHEMAFVLPDHADEEHCRKVGKIICKELTESQFEYTNQTVTCTCSVGITLITDKDEGVRDIIKKADAACRAAKVKGGNTYYIFPTALKREKSKKPALPSITSTSTNSIIKPVNVDSSPSEALTKITTAAQAYIANKLENTAELAVAKLLQSNRQQIRYKAYAPIDNDEEVETQFLYHISMYCLDFAGNEIDDPIILRAARAHGLDAGLDLYASKFIINQAKKFKKEHTQSVAMMCMLKTASFKRLRFFQKLLTLLNKTGQESIGQSLIYKISVDDYVSQPKEIIDVLAQLKQRFGVRFCMHNINNHLSLKLSKHRNIFDFVEISIAAFDSSTKEMEKCVSEELTGSSVKLILTDVDSPELLMQSLLILPDYIEGEYIAHVSDNMELTSSTMMHVQL